MKMRKLIIEVTNLYEISVDDNSPIVKDYADDNELVDDLASYHFSTLPVIGNGVELIDVQLESVTIIS
jgi:hypothetical protein